MNGCSLLTGTLALGASVFFFLTGLRLTQRGRIAPRTVLVRAGAAMLGYWAVFLPRLIYLRLAGLSDIGRWTILREMLTLGDSVVPFAGLVGGYAVGLVLIAVLGRMAQPHPAFSFWLYVVMPVTCAQVLRFYAPGLPELCRVLGHVQLAMGPMGAGCVAARAGLARRADGRLARLAPRALRAALLGAALLALAGHALAPSLTLGSLQLVGDRVRFTFDLDLLYAPVLAYALHRLARGIAPAAGGEGGAARDGRCAAPGEAAMRAPYFDREATAQIKGVALVMMFIHHFFTFPEWLQEGIAYPQLAGFAALCRLPLAMCVPVFAFLTGYFYAPRENKTVRYSLVKITDLLVPYWLITVLLYLLAAWGGAQLSLGGFVRELSGLDQTVMIYNWYVCFYWMILLLLPLLCRLPHRHIAGAACVLILLPVLGATALKALAPGCEAAVNAAWAMLDGICGLGAGYLCARFSLFERGFDAVLGKRRDGRRSAVHLAACAALLAMAFFGRYYAPRVILPLPFGGEAWALRISMDGFYVPVFVYALCNLLTALVPGALRRVLAQLGRYSMPMWLLSCAFHNAGSGTLQRLLYAPGRPALVLAWGLLLCYLAARALDAPTRALLRCKNRLMGTAKP